MGLRELLKRFFGDGRTRPRFSADEESIRRTDGEQVTESARWNRLARIELVTTDDGPVGEDLYMLLTEVGGSGIAVPSSAWDELGLVERVQSLDGFDNEAFIEAMGSTESQRFPVWSR